jgi:hypothetical protein
MIPRMTEPDTEERRITTVPLAGHEFQIRELDGLQMMHLGRYAKILMRDDLTGMQKVDAADRMLRILNSSVLDESEREKLIEMEESGDVTLKDLIAFSRKFREMDEPQVAVVTRRRGRPRKSA